MSSNVGLTTPRGSGTSGYVQRNQSYLKPRDAPYPSASSTSTFAIHKQRQPDAAILEHDRKRQIELKVFELRDKMEDEEKDEDEIEDACSALRKKLEREGGEGEKKGAKGLKSHQVHEIARAKIEESEKLRRALGIRDDYEEGGHWRRQEERRREEVLKEVKGRDDED